MKKIGIAIFTLIVILLIGITIFSKRSRIGLMERNNISNISNVSDSKVDSEENSEEKEKYRKEINKVEREILEISNQINNKN